MTEGTRPGHDDAGGEPRGGCRLSVHPWGAEGVSLGGSLDPDLGSPWERVGGSVGHPLPPQLAFQGLLQAGGQPEPPLPSPCLTPKGLHGALSGKLRHRELLSQGHAEQEEQSGGTAPLPPRASPKLGLPAPPCEGSRGAHHACSELVRSQPARPSAGLEPGIALRRGSPCTASGSFPAAKSNLIFN